MPKIIDYPRATLRGSLELAQAVKELGGKCSVELAGDKLNKKMGGAFQALVGSAVRYGLVLNKKGQLEVTPLFRNFTHAYTAEESQQVLKQAFLAPGLFKDIYARFEGKELPVSHFQKMLIREFGVPDDVSSRVEKYFLEGAKQCGLLDANNVLASGTQVGVNVEANSEEIDEEDSSASAQSRDAGSKGRVSQGEDRREPDGYSVRIFGPGIDSLIKIAEPEDLLIVRAMLKKVERKLVESEGEFFEEES